MKNIMRQKTNESYRVLFVILPLVLLACLGLYYLLSESQTNTSVNSENSVWDLCSYNFSGESVQITGMVEVIPNALLTPDEFILRESEVIFLDTAFPEQFGTSRIRLRVSDKDGWYTLTRTSIDYSTRLFVNGELLTEVGSPGISAPTSTPNIERITFTAQAVDGVIELVQQSSNFVHRSGGYHGGWRIGNTSLARAVTAADFAITLEMGAYLTLFMIHLLLFLMLPTYRPNLYFALYCFTWFLRMGTTGSSLFSVLIPALSWNLKFRMEYSAISIAILLTTLIIKEVFPGIMQRWAIHVSIFINAVFLLFCLILSKKTLSIVAPYFLCLCVLSGLYVTIRFITKLRKPSVEQILILLGIMGIVCTALRDIIYFARSVLEPPFIYVEITQISVLAFTLLSTAAFFISTMHEVTKARESQSRLIAENKALDSVNRFKNDIIANLTHEMRTPLSVMSVYAQLVVKELRKQEPDTQMADDLDTISSEANRLSDMASEALEMTELNSKAKEKSILNLGELLGQTARLFAPTLRKQGNKLVQEFPVAALYVYANAGELTQVVWNLIQNANAHTKNGEIIIRLKMEEEWIIAEIVDNGEGVAPDILQTVFERGRKGSKGGAGLGLSISHDIISSHDGTLTLENNSSGGATARFALPMSEGGGDIE